MKKWEEQNQEMKKNAEFLYNLCRDTWVKDCDGQPMKNGTVIGKCGCPHTHNMEQYCVEEGAKLTIDDFIFEKIAVAFNSPEEAKEFAKMVEERDLIDVCGDSSEKFFNEVVVGAFKVFEGQPISVAFGFEEIDKKYRGRLSFCELDGMDDPHYIENGWKIVPFEDFVQAPPVEVPPVTPEPDEERPDYDFPYEITIHCDGKTTTAEMKVNGKIVRESCARRNPEDKFDFKVGAEYAFNRLFEKKREIRIGDRVVIGEIKITTEHKWLEGKHGTVIGIERGVHVERISPNPVDIAHVRIDGHGIRRIYVGRLKHE